MVETIRFRLGLALHHIFIGSMLRLNFLSVRLTFQFHAMVFRFAAFAIGSVRSASASVSVLRFVLLKHP